MSLLDGRLLRLYAVFVLVIAGLAVWISYRGRSLFESHYEVPEKRLGRRARVLTEEEQEEARRRNVTLSRLLRPGDPSAKENPTLTIPLLRTRPNGVVAFKADWDSEDARYRSGFLSQKGFDLLEARLTGLVERVQRPASDAAPPHRRFVLESTRPLMKSDWRVLLEEIETSDASSFTPVEIKLSTAEIAWPKGQSARDWVLRRPPLKDIISQEALQLRDPRLVRMALAKLPFAGLYRDGSNAETTVLLSVNLFGDD